MAEEERMDHTSGGVGGTARVGETKLRVDQLAEGQVRIAAELVEVAKAFASVRDFLPKRLDERDRLDPTSPHDIACPHGSVSERSRR